jgi:putative Holliday junction resolvase
MGVDLGNARVGISLSDPELSVATPLCNVSVWSDYFEALDDVVDLIAEHAVTHVVVGYPLNMDGSEGKAAKKARRWSSQLGKRLRQAENDHPDSAELNAVDIELKDERLTTVSAHRQLSEAGRGSKKHRQVVDQQSAVLILQSALDQTAHQREEGDA